MAADGKTTLELTWPGKAQRPRLPPHVLVEDPARSHRAGADDGRADNRVIRGDNLPALGALAGELAGAVKCVYIDPPFNTDQSFAHYDDGLEHAQWLSRLRDRLEVLRALLRPDGSLVVHIDDNELGYLIVLLDELFGRANRVAVVTFKQGSATGHKAINPGCVSTTNFVLIYARDRARWAWNRVFTARGRDPRYSRFIANRDEPHARWRLVTLAAAFARSLGVTERASKARPDYEDRLGAFVLAHANCVVQLARPRYDAVSAAARARIDWSRAHPDEVVRLEREGFSDMYLLRGQRILFYQDKLKRVDGRLVAGEPLTTLWADIHSNNLHKEGGVDFPKGKKPEALLKRVLDLCTEPGDLVLDAYAGSGTTGAVAHKMGRRWILVEEGEHCETHVVPRLRRVIDGADPDGVSRAVGWRGGGGFRYFRVAPA